MISFIRHPHHLVQESPWPFMASLAGGFLTSGLVLWFHIQNRILFILAIVLMVVIMYQWWRDVIIEARFIGLHSIDVEKGHRLGMLLFISSEVLFFLSFFWAFYHSSLAPNVEIGRVWPPKGISPFNAFEVPLLNTIVLLSSGVTVTWAHHRLIAGEHTSVILSLGMTVVLGIYFTRLQALEYLEAPFRFADSIYGSTFFIATGFHGLHVLIGTLLLLTCEARLILGHFRKIHHFGFEASAWYWHFVDVVWLFLFISIYWWGGS